MNVGIASDQARMKCLDPVTSIGPSTPVRVMDLGGDLLTIGVEKEYFPGGLVQIIFNRQIIMGTITACERAVEGFVLRVRRSVL